MLAAPAAAPTTPSAEASPPATTAAVLCNEAGLALHGGAVVALRERHGVRACRGWVGRHVGPWAPYIRLC